MLNIYFGTTERRWPARLSQEENISAGCSKGLSARPQPMEAPEA
jgi:hypothetical protein